MKNYLELGSAPYDEKCVQVTNKKPYEEEMQAECKRYKELLEKRFPHYPVEFGVKSFPHDFGKYYEVVVRFDDFCRCQIEAAYYVEHNLPKTWNDDKVFGKEWQK